MPILLTYVTSPLSLLLVMINKWKSHFMTANASINENGKKSLGYLAQGGSGIGAVGVEM